MTQRPQHLRAVHLLRKLDPAEWSGTEVAIQRLFAGLHVHGVTPVAYCPSIEGQSSSDPLTRSGYEVRRFHAFVPVLGMPRQRKRQLVAVGGNLMSFDLIPALWRERHIGVIHAHTLGRLGGIALTLAKQRGVPFVVTIHGGVLDLPVRIKQSFNAPPDRGWEWGKLFGLLFQSHRLFRDADAILTCNAQEAALLQQQLPGKLVVVHPHGLDLEMFQQDQRQAAREAFPRIRERQVLLCLGRIDPVKNQSWLIEQAPSIFERHRNTIIVLAGPSTDEPYYAVLKQRITQLGLQKRVLLTGGLPADDPRLIGLLQSATALLLPSLSETFGLVILEAWAAGTMVLSANASGPAALIRNGQNGWLFDLEQPATFHEALDWTLTHPDLVAEMGARGGKLSQEFSVQTIAGRMKALYERLIEEKHALRNHS
jgi:glycosyltransferase involved in cell wall biosynthesis